MNQPLHEAFELPATQQFSIEVVSVQVVRIEVVSIEVVSVEVMTMEVVSVEVVRVEVVSVDTFTVVSAALGRSPHWMLKQFSVIGPLHWQKATSSNPTLSNYQYYLPYHFLHRCCLNRLHCLCHHYLQ